MKSVKPGRGPSFMNGVGYVAAAVFGIFWMILAGGIGAPGLFVAFGAIFVLMAVAGAIYQFSNATRKNRFSAFDITDEQEEPDELNQYFGKNGAGYMPEKQEPAHAIAPIAAKRCRRTIASAPSAEMSSSKSIKVNDPPPTGRGSFFIDAIVIFYPCFPCGTGRYPPCRGSHRQSRA